MITRSTELATNLAQMKVRGILCYSTYFHSVVNIVMYCTSLANLHGFHIYKEPMHRPVVSFAI